MEFVILLAAAAAIAYCVMEFIRTPREFRYKISARDYEQVKLNEKFEAGQYVRVAASRNKSYLKSIAIFVAFLPVVWALFEFKQRALPSCEEVFGINKAWVLVNVGLFGPIIFMLPFSAVLAKRGLLGLKTGYYPPIGMPSETPYVAKRGIFPMLSAVISILVLPLLLHGLYLAFHLVSVQMSGGAGYAGFVEKLHCAHNPSLKADGPDGPPP